MLAASRGFAPTSPSVTGEARLNIESAASQAYLAHLAQEQADFIAAATKAIPEAKVTYQYDVVLNGVAMIVPADQVADLAKLPGVEAIYPDELLQTADGQQPAVHRRADRSGTSWAARKASGENVDRGRARHRHLAGAPVFLRPRSFGQGLWRRRLRRCREPRACQFSGGANPGAAFTCNNKLIGAHRFMSTYEASSACSRTNTPRRATMTATARTRPAPPPATPRVQASIFGVPRGTVSGIAPRAHVITYKVCGVAGCYGSDSAAAVQQAILDGVNVINFSISGGANPYADAVEQAFLDAYAAGVFVAASAGNAGPAPDTTAHRGPWVTTVAASTQNRAFETTATVVGDGGASLSLHGTSITAGIAPLPVCRADRRSSATARSPRAAWPARSSSAARGNTGRAERATTSSRAALRG